MVMMMMMMMLMMMMMMLMTQQPPPRRGSRPTPPGPGPGLRARTTALQRATKLGVQRRRCRVFHSALQSVVIPTVDAITI
eukprot:3403293-Karenia_brevis.AAC.1